jgi:hypothetical protein
MKVKGNHKARAVPQGQRGARGAKSENRGRGARGAHSQVCPLSRRWYRQRYWATTLCSAHIVSSDSTECVELELVEWSYWLRS